MITGMVIAAIGQRVDVRLVEEHVAERLGLIPEPVSTQVIPRDRHAAFFAALGVIAGSVERIAVESAGLRGVRFAKLTRASAVER